MSATFPLKTNNRKSNKEYEKKTSIIKLDYRSKFEKDTFSGGAIMSSNETYIT